MTVCLTPGTKIILFDRDSALQGGSYIQRLYSYSIMFFPTRLIGATALLSGFAVASPRPESAMGNEVANPTPSYGSGSSSWGNPNYNSCVQRALQLETSRLSSKS